MKYLFLLFALFYCSLTFATSCTDSIYLKGYWVIRYNKEEIINKKCNAIKRAMNRPYELAIDLENESFFIPTDSILKSLATSIQAHTLFHQKTIFFIKNPKRAKNYLTKKCGQSFALENTNRLVNNDKYYILNNESGDDIFCIYYLEGWALMATVENNKANQLSLDLTPDDIIKGNAFNIVVLSHLNALVDDFIHLEGFTSALLNE